MPMLRYLDPQTGVWHDWWFVAKGEKGDKGDKGDPGVPGSTPHMDDLIDVNATGPAVGDMLVWNGSVWEKAASSTTVHAAGDGRYLKLTGGIMTGGIDMSGPLQALYIVADGGITAGTGIVSNGTVAKVSAPAYSDDAANKAYVDGRIWTGSQAAYDAIATKDPTVLYVVV